MDTYWLTGREARIPLHECSTFDWSLEHTSSMLAPRRGDLTKQGTVESTTSTGTHFHYLFSYRCFFQIFSNSII